MPALIDPFNLVPSGPFQPVLSYWFATWVRIIYTEWRPWLVSLAEIAGGSADSIQIFEEQSVPILDNISRVEILHLPQGDMVHIRGSSSYTQVTAQVLNSAFTSIEPWPGQVSVYNSSRAGQIWDGIASSVGSPWLAMGHSLGGALASLLSIYGASACWTAGEPRQGNGTYAAGRSDAQKLRIVNDEDIVPLVPPNAGVELGLVAAPLWAAGIFPATTYRHWGYARRLFSSGRSVETGEQTSGVEAVDYARQILTGGAWVEGHYQAEYTRRIRAHIPITFPCPLLDNRILGLRELDVLNQQINESEGVEWGIDGRDSAQLVLSGDVWQNDTEDYGETQNRLEQSIYPFVCDGKPEMS